MALKKATRGSQYPLVAEFTFEIGDTMVNTAGAADAFATVAAHVFDVINLPVNAVVINGGVVTETAFTGSTAYNITVGDSAVANLYLDTTNRVAAGRTAIIPTGYVGLGENIRMTATPTGAAATAGKLTVRIEYVTRDKMHETQTH